MLDPTSKIDQVLNQSLHAIQDYHKLIADHEAEGVSVTKESKRQKVLEKLMHSLEDMRTLLIKELDENRFIQIDTPLLSTLNKAFNQLAKDESTKNKINYVHVALYGANVPFWNTLREVQNLLHTVESLRARSKKIGKIDSLDSAKGNREENA